MEKSTIFRKLTISMAMVNSYIKLPEIDPGKPTWVRTTVVTTLNFNLANTRMLVDGALFL